MKKINLLALALSATTLAGGQNFTLKAPSKELQINISIKDHLEYSIVYKGKTVLQPSLISMTLSDGTVLGQQPKLKKKTSTSISNLVDPPYGFRHTYAEHYNELTLQFKGNYALVARAYDEGVAFRFVTAFKDSIIIRKENTQFRFDEDNRLTGLLQDHLHAYESIYQHKKITQTQGLYACLPLLVHLPDNLKMMISESDLLDYPGLYLVKDNAHENALTAFLPPLPSQVEPGGHMKFNLVVKSAHDYIAKTTGSRSFPWRVISIAEQEKEFLNNPIVYLLATPSKIGDASWVKPGKVSWDWWNALNLEGVNFKTGINTATYQYFIDFAAKNGIEYVNLDEGWSDQHDLLKLSDKINMNELVHYAQQKKVKLILWVVWRTLDAQLLPAMDQFEKWGIAGIKVDFMDRDDQEMVNFYERVAKEAAKHKLLVNFHGAFKPTGLERTYPNVINREAVLGMEYDKWSSDCTPEDDINKAFLRMFAGPMDYTPGAMRNANKKNFRSINELPMSQGTRCHELAKFVAFYAPLQMLNDAPTAYEKEPVVLNYLSKVPTTWDETLPLDGKLGEYLVIARRKGHTWYIGGMTNWDARSVQVDLSFLKGSKYKAEIFTDGINADRLAHDYRHALIPIDPKQPFTANMAPGGGFVMVINEN